MGFDSPWLLLGAAAGLIPVVIHLINRQRARVLPFAALEFLVLSDRRLAERLKLKQILVLLLRVALLVGLAFALAKPYLEPDHAAITDLTAPGAVVLVIDDSASMNARHPRGGGTLLEHAREEARRIIEQAGRATSLAIVGAARPPRLLTQGLTYDRTSLARALSRVVPTALASDLEAALHEAERVLAASGEVNRRVIIIGDQAAHAWESVAEPWSLRHSPVAALHDVRDGQPIDNRAIVRVGAARAPELGPQHIHLEVEVASYATHPETLSVTVEFGDRRVAGQLTLAAGGRATKRFTEVVEPGQVLKGTARLEPDALPEDDLHHFVLDPGQRLEALVVNGAPSEVPWLDEVFFLRTALEAAGAGWRVTTTTTPDLRQEMLSGVDVVVLANVGRLSEATRAALEGFVRAGGGLLAAAGDQWTDETAKTYGALLPLPTRGQKRVAHPDDPGSGIHALGVGKLDPTHPALEVFGGVDDASLYRTQVFGYLLVDSAAASTTPEAGPVRIPLSFTGGIPGLVERELGRGRTMFWTTSLDRDWSDLCIRSSFLPLVRQLLLHLGGGLRAQVSTEVRAGDPLVFASPPGNGALFLTAPDGAETELPADTDTAEVLNTRLPGHYEVRRRGEGGSTLLLAVNQDRSESDLQPADPARLASLLERPGSGPGESPANHAETAPGNPSEAGRTPLWPMVMVALFALLLSEAWIVLRG
jgi:hypothetical protein